MPTQLNSKWLKRMLWVWVTERSGGRAGFTQGCHQRLFSSICSLGLCGTSIILGWVSLMVTKKMQQFRASQPHIIPSKVRERATFQNLLQKRIRETGVTYFINASSQCPPMLHQTKPDHLYIPEPIPTGREIFCADGLCTKKDGVTQIGLDKAWTISPGLHGCTERKRDERVLGRWSVTEDYISFLGQPHPMGDSRQPFLQLKCLSLPDNIRIRPNVMMPFIFWTYGKAFRFIPQKFHLSRLSQLVVIQTENRKPLPTQLDWVRSPA